MKSDNVTAFFWIVIAIFSRLIPHPANATPLIALTIQAQSRFNKKISLMIVFISLLISDIFLSFFNNFSILGSWTLFTYSGLFLVWILGFFTRKYTKKNHKINILMTLFGVFIYWTWTNFGVWIVSDIYPHSLNGLVECYTCAVPFLYNNLLANVAFCFIADQIHIQNKLIAHAKIKRCRFMPN